MDVLRLGKLLKSRSFFFTVMILILGSLTASVAEASSNNRQPRYAENFVASIVPKISEVLKAFPGTLAAKLPLKLIVAQAALESGYGRSRIAGRERNNLFGLMSGRAPMRFKDREGSILRYAMTLEGHPAYGRLRSMAASYDGVLPANKVLPLLGSYSTNPRYARLLVRMMKSPLIAPLENAEYVKTNIPEPLLREDSPTNAEPENGTRSATLEYVEPAKSPPEPTETAVA